MAKYKCSVCGYIYDEAASGAISNLEKCPVCGQPVRVFEKLDESADRAVEGSEENPLSYDAAYARMDESCRYMKEIHQMAVTGKSIIEAMGTQMPMPNWDDILILGAQLNPPPLDEHEEIDTTTIIGTNANVQWY